MKLLGKFSVLFVASIIVLLPNFSICAPLSSICNNVTLGPLSAGGQPTFRILLQGSCKKEYLKLGSLTDESDDGEWQQTYFFGTYDYDTGQATETIYIIGGILAEYGYGCSKNPWSHGPGPASCSLTKKSYSKDGRGVDFQFPSPFSAALMPTTIMAGVAKWESTTPVDQLLSDWDPYAGSQGTDEILITEPTHYQVIPETAKGLYIDFRYYEIGFLIDMFDLTIEKRVSAPEWVGDIKMPETLTHIWEQHFEAKSLDGSVYKPFPISLEFGQNSPGLYRVRVRATVGRSNTEFSTAWSSWRYFWIGQPERMNVAEMDKLVQSTSQAQSFIHSSIHKRALINNEDNLKQQVIKEMKMTGLNHPERQHTGVGNKLIALKKSKITAQPSGNVSQSLKIERRTKSNQKHTTTKSFTAAPKLIPVPQAWTIPAGGLATLSVKHPAGRKPFFEFQYHDGKRWQKTGSIRPVVMQSSQTGGSDQVVTQAKFRVAEAGKYRYRVKLDTPGAMYSQYREFTVGHQTRSLTQASKLPGTPTKVGDIAATQSSKVIGSNDTGSGTDQSFHKHTTDNLSPQIKKQRHSPLELRPAPPKSPAKIVQPQNNQTFRMPANIVIKTSHDPGFQLIQEFKIGTAQYKKLQKLKFGNLAAGTYKVRVYYQGKAPSTGDTVKFTVLPPQQQSATSKSKAKSIASPEQ
ncbi:MAG: hypothetical protein KJO32_04990, partial [Deltaproteobacteria bacterium]|nr:hypothetical protein [Deltaproteobacteria bacterium]